MYFEIMLEKLYIKIFVKKNKIMHALLEHFTYSFFKYIKEKKFNVNFL